MGASVANLTSISRFITAFGSSSSLRRARDAQSNWGYITSALPGSARGLYLVVSDVEAARDELITCGATASEVFHVGAKGAKFQSDGTSGRVPQTHKTWAFALVIPRSGCKAIRRG